MAERLVASQDERVRFPPPAPAATFDCPPKSAARSPDCLSENRGALPAVVVPPALRPASWTPCTRGRLPELLSLPSEERRALTRLSIGEQGFDSPGGRQDECVWGVHVVGSSPIHRCARGRRGGRPVVGQPLPRSRRLDLGRMVKWQTLQVENLAPHREREGSTPSPSTGRHGRALHALRGGARGAPHPCPPPGASPLRDGRPTRRTPVLQTGNRGATPRHSTLASPNPRRRAPRPLTRGS